MSHMKAPSTRRFNKLPVDDREATSTLGRSDYPTTNAKTVRRLIIATTIGNAFEFFDLTVYSFFAGLLGKLFFPLASNEQQLLLSVGTFGIGIAARPLGALFFGLLADRIGRVATMNFTLVTMAVGTGVIGAMPTYAQIGVSAPWLIVAARLLQGISSGGEVGVSTGLLAESAVPARRGFVTSWQFASQGAAALAGSLIGFLLSRFLPVDALQSWGWRVPFLAGTAIAPLGLYLRYRFGDELSDAVVLRPKASALLKAVLVRDIRLVLIAVLLVVGGTSAHFIVLFYMSTYAISVLHLPMDVALWCGVVAGAVMLIVSPIGGLWSDRFGRKKISGISRAVLTILIYPAFWLVGHAPSVQMLYGVVAVLAAIHAINAGSTGALLAELFPRSTRVTALSIAFAVGVSIFGGFAQFFVAWLTKKTGDPTAPAWYVALCGALSLLALSRVADKTRQIV